MDKETDALMAELAEMNVGFPPALLQKLEHDLTFKALLDLLDAAGIVPKASLGQRFKELKLQAMKEIVADAKVKVAVRRAEAARAELLRGVPGMRA